MKLSGAQVAAVRAALLDGYHSEDDLEAMVRIGLDENLAAIAGGETLDAVVLSLIGWAERTDKVLPLVDAAQAYNPGNAALQALHAQAHTWELDASPRQVSTGAGTPAVAGEQTHRSRWIIGGLIAAALLIALAALFMQQFTTRSPNPTPQVITWSGRVVDAQSGRPVAQAKIMFEAQGTPIIVYSDSEGLFRVTSPDETPINGRLFVEANGFQPYDRFVTVDAVSSLLEVRLSAAQ